MRLRIVNYNHKYMGYNTFSNVGTAVFAIALHEFVHTMILESLIAAIENANAGLLKFKLILIFYACMYNVDRFKLIHELNL